MHLLIPMVLALSSTALASAPDPADGHAEQAHPEPGHGADHHTYGDDIDGDNIPNWRDATNGSEQNTDTYVLPSIGYHAFNLLLLIAVLAYFVRRPLLDTFRARAQGIRKELNDSARERDEADKRHRGLLGRLEKIEAEVTTMHDEAAASAARDEAKLVERAEREAIRVAEQSQRTIRDEGARARQALRNEAVELAVKLAEETLRSQVGSNDQQTLARDFLDSLQAAKEAPRG